ncbi:MAG: DUF4145 domain-containing protein [Candidatus Geothermincolia bacterium]
MKCPHCLVEFHDELNTIQIARDEDGIWAIESYMCPNPACCRAIIFLARQEIMGHGMFMVATTIDSRLIRPPSTTRAIPHEVNDPDIRADFDEACLVLPYSPKASAALSRRCLQHLLEKKAGVKKSNLRDEIAEVLPKLPSDLRDAIDAVRNYGNFSAHPMEDENTGIILDVEPGEAEWTLDILEELFEYYYVRPAVIARKKAALDAKLSQAGKPPSQ